VATNRAIYEHAIAMLIGKPASDFSMPVKVLTTPVPVVPVDIPSKLLQRRPDVAAAERTMAEANALIGVETAAYFPTLDLTAGGGWEAAAISTFSPLRPASGRSELPHLKRSSTAACALDPPSVQRAIQCRRGGLPANRSDGLSTG
jgi:outer membrane protein TolC